MLQIIMSSQINSSLLLQHPLHINSLIQGMSYVIIIVTAKCCSDLTLLCIDNKHFNLQYHAVVIFIPEFGGKTD